MFFNLSLVSAEVSQATFKSGKLKRPTSLNGKVSIIKDADYPGQPVLAQEYLKANG